MLLVKALQEVEAVARVGAGDDAVVELVQQQFVAVGVRGGVHGRLADGRVGAAVHIDLDPQLRWLDGPGGPVVGEGGGLGLVEGLGGEDEE